VNIFQKLIGQSRWLILVWGVVATFVVVMVTSQFVRHLREEQQVALFLSQNQLPGKPGSIERAIATSDLLRSVFNVDSKSWKFMNKASEPALDFSCADLLQWHEGNCGKGARVLVKLLHSQGYNACRVNFQGRGFSNRTSHTLVSVIINGQEYFIDSVNSIDEINQYLRNNQVNASSFGLTDYRDRSKKIVNQLDTTSVINRLFIAYSYESIPYTKLVSVAGLNMRILNFDRPSGFVGYLAESIYLVYSIFWLLLLVIWIVVGVVACRKYLKFR
jgi:membrane protein implicated in regulation of membrane protease activity